jgi:hypothetical protein
VSLLEKVLKLQRSTGATEAAAQTSALLVDLVKDPKERAAARREGRAADGRTRRRPRGRGTAGDRRWSRIRRTRRRWSRCAAWRQAAQGIRAVRQAGPRARRAGAPAADAASRRGAPSCGSATASWRGAQEGAVTAIEAFEQVVALDPEQLEAREHLADALQGSRRVRGRRGRESPQAAGAGRDARGFAARAGGGVREARAARIARAAATRCCRCWASRPKDEEAFLDAHPSQDLKPDDPYAAAVEEQDRRAHLALPEATLMSEIFSCLWEGAPGLIGQRLEDFGVSSNDKVSPMSDLDLGKIYGQVAKALGNRKTALYVRPDGGPSDVNIVVQAPPALVVGPALAATAKGAEVRFQLGRGSSCRAPNTSWPPAFAPSSSRRCSAAFFAPSTRATRAGVPARATPPPSRPHG